MQLINSVSNMADGFEFDMSTDVTTYLAENDEVIALEHKLWVTDAIYHELDKAHPFMYSVRVEADVDDSFIITVVEA